MRLPPGGLLELSGSDGKAAMFCLGGGVFQRCGRTCPAAFVPFWFELRSCAYRWRSQSAAYGKDERHARAGDSHLGQREGDGAGVVLGWRFLSAKDVQAGRVAELLDVAIPLGSTFYRVYPEAHSRRPNTTAL